MNFFIIVFITIFALTFVTASGNDAAYYKKMRKLAIGCTPETKSWKDPDSPCNTCSCMSDGVVICTRMKCGKNYEIPEENPVPEPEPVLEPEPEPEPEREVETEPQNGDAEVIRVYKKLRNDAIGCRPGQDVSTEPCAGCSCILPGVMRCVRINCLLPVSLRKSGLRIATNPGVMTTNVRVGGSKKIVKAPVAVR